MGEIALNLIAIGERIRTLRGNLTQAAFADRLDLERKTVGRYESGDRAPDALALLRLMEEFGADPAWVLTGRGVAPTLTADERELLALFRAASLAVKAAAVGALQGGAHAAQPRKPQKQVFNGDVSGQVAMGQIINKGKSEQ